MIFRLEISNKLKYKLLKKGEPYFFNIWLKLRFLGFCKVSTTGTCRNKVDKFIPNPSIL